MFKYETHLHTFPVSKCAKASVEESLLFYKELGYDGVFITNHFIDGNINISPLETYQKRINFYFSDYEEALILSQKIGIKVFLGIEITYKGTDFLIYGLDKNFFLNHPEYENKSMKEKLIFLKENGALIIQAHPFREAHYIDHIRLFPRQVDGVEVINACRTDLENKMANIYAENYQLIKFAGSDNHLASKQEKLAGVKFNQEIKSEKEFIELIKQNKFEIFFERNKNYV